MFAGDNGTPNGAIRPDIPPHQSKPSSFEGGLRVPLIVSGAGVTEPGVSEGLAQLADIYPTVLHAAGVDPTSLTDSTGAAVVLDGLSLHPAFADPAAHSGHELLLHSEFGPVGDPAAAARNINAIRTATHKFVRDGNGTEYLYDLSNTPYDEDDQVEAGTADPVVLESFRAQLDEALERTPYIP